MNTDGSDECSTDGCDREEAVFPAANVQHSLVEIEQTLQPAHHARIHTEQLS